MLRENLKLFVCNTALSGITAIAIMAVFSNPVAHQDMAAFAGKKLKHDRWLASIVSKPESFIYDNDGTGGAAPVILNENDEKLTVFNFGKPQNFRGYAFTQTPEIARRISAKTTVNRSGKGDLPVAPNTRQHAILSAGQIFDRTAIFTAPDETLWPRVAFVAAETKTGLPDKKADRPRTQVQVAEKSAQPLPLIPHGAIAALEKDAEIKAGEEIDRTHTASVVNVTASQTGYAPNDKKDPRAVFEAVLARRDGRATLPDAPAAEKSAELPAITRLEDNTLVPQPRLKPEVSETLDPAAKKPKKKQHFWAAFKLPGSVYKKTQQRCLAAAIYFESRGEPEVGQAAVAQVVLNRVKAPAYPNTICGVVYQNKHWRNRCQFSFACDGVYDRVNDKESWERAVRVARDVSRGTTYLEKVADSTHYHANYVNPRWGRSMKVLTKIGVHIFYRTKNGGWS